MKKSRRKYDAEFKRQAVRMVTDDHKSCHAVEKALGVGQGIVYRWLREAKEDPQNCFTGNGHTKPSPADMVYSPILFFGSFHFRQSLDVRLEFGDYYASVFDIVSFILSVLAFTTLNWYVPNMKVKSFSAFLGGLVAGVLFEVERQGFGEFIKLSGQTQTIYGAFGIQILFLTSLFVVSLFLLFGAEVTYVH